MSSTTDGRGPWIQNWDGSPCYPFDVRADEIRVEEIAHVLALQCRFGGKCLKFYSVAEHSVRVSRLVDQVWPQAPHMGLWGLLHDAAEAYGLPDLCRPVKQVMPGYSAAENRTLQAVAEKFCLPWPMAEFIHAADDILLATERRDLMNECDMDWDLTAEPLPGRIEPWSCEEAEEAFLATFHDLQNRRTR